MFSFSSNNFPVSPFNTTQTGNLTSISGWSPPTSFRSVIGPVTDPSSYSEYFATTTFIVSPSPTYPEWDGQDNALANYDGTTWQFTTPSEGMLVWDIITNAFIYFDTTSTWSAFPQQFTSTDAGKLALIADWAPTSAFRSVYGPIADPTAYSAYFSSATFLVSASPTLPEWSGQAKKFANYDGENWQFYTPAEGTMVWDIISNAFFYYNTAGSWVAFPQQFSSGDATTLTMAAGWAPKTAFRSVIANLADPTTPVNYVSYFGTHTFIVGSNPTYSPWGGQAGNLANYGSGGWYFTTPSEGLMVWDIISNAFLYYDTTSTWSAFPQQFSTATANTLTQVSQWAPGTSFRAAYGPLNNPTTPVDYSSHFGTHTFIVGASPTYAAWSGKAGNLAVYDGSTWHFEAPQSGMIVFSLDGLLYRYYNWVSGLWNAWLYPGVAPANLAFTAVNGSDVRPAPTDHVHSNAAGSNGAQFGSTTTLWNHNIGALSTSQVTAASGSTLTIGLMSAADTTNVIWATATGGNVTINLPTATEKRYMTITFIINSGRTVTINPAGTDTINNVNSALSLSNTSNGTHRHITCNGAGAWAIL